MEWITHKKRFFLFVAGLCFLLSVSVVLGFGYYLVNPLRRPGHSRVFQVREGATLREVAGNLEDKGIIKDHFLFLLWGRLMGYGREIKAGDYLLSPSMPPLEIINILTRGRMMTYAVTIPEGFDCRQIAALLAEKRLADGDAFLRLTEDPDLAKAYGISGPGLEGYLYPDTYVFSRGLTPKTLIDVMVKRFREVIAPYARRIQESGLSLQEVVTLASMVEKETGKAEERPIIASVFLNRLKKRMRLESDPTVIYGLPHFSGDLTKKDLETPSPYNTYIIRGLPPGPIANPGIQSIRAVLFPAHTHYLYFVSKNNGTHHFSRTLEEHNRAVALYQKNTHHKKKKSL